MGSPVRILEMRLRVGSVRRTLNDLLFTMLSHSNSPSGPLLNQLTMAIQPIKLLVSNFKSGLLSAVVSCHSAQNPCDPPPPHPPPIHHIRLNSSSLLLISFRSSKSQCLDSTEGFSSTTHSFPSLTKVSPH